MRTTPRPPHPVSGGKENQLRMNKHIRFASMIVIVAVRFPTAAGVNVTVIVHFAPTASDVLQVLDVIVKSLLLVPPSVMLVMVSAT